MYARISKSKFDHDSAFFSSSCGGRASVDGALGDMAIEIPAADVQALSLDEGRRMVTRHAGIYLFLPLLAQLQFDNLVSG